MVAGFAGAHAQGEVMAVSGHCITPVVNLRLMSTVAKVALPAAKRPSTERRTYDGLKVK